MSEQRAAARIVYVGTFTTPSRGGKAVGIDVFRMDQTTGALTCVQTVPNVANPSFLAIHPNGRSLYCNNAIPDYEGQASGAVSAFAIAPDSGRLTFLNQQPSGGTNPAHVSVDPTGRYALAANYGGGSVAVLPIEADGRLGAPTDIVPHRGPPGPVRSRQEASHAHQIPFDPSGQFVLVNDLGLDRTYVYRLDAANGRLVPNDPPFVAAEPGAGPRHLAFHPNRRHVYVLNEIASSIRQHAWDERRGTLAPLATVSTLPAGFQGQSTTAQILVAPSGRFVYASNRGNDSIAIFAVDAETGRLTPIGHESTRGRTPRNFNIDPSGTFLYAANQDSDTIVTFRVDIEIGRLTATGQVTEAKTPVCILFGSTVA